MSNVEGDCHVQGEAFWHDDSAEPNPPIALPEALAEHLREEEYACVHEASSLGTLFVVKALRHRLSKVVPHLSRDQIPELVRFALVLRGQIPDQRFDFEQAKAEVMRLAQF